MCRCGKLNQCIERYNKEPCKESKSKEIHTKSHLTVKRRKQIDRERHTQSPHRNNPCLDIATAKPSSQQRPYDNTHTRQRQKPLCYHRISDTKLSLEILSKDSHNHLRDPPEDTQPNDTEPYGFIGFKELEVLFEIAQILIFFCFKFHGTLFALFRTHQSFCQQVLYDTSSDKQVAQRCHIR